MNSFDPVEHVYKINGRAVPSVTQIINEVLQIEHYGATDFHLQRGSTVHACAAMIAQGKEFDLDLSNQSPDEAAGIMGMLEAVRRFYREIKPSVISVEQSVYSSRYMYAGTFDLLCGMSCMTNLVDFKSNLTDTVPLQLAGYAIALKEGGGYDVRLGIGVELHTDGSYKTSEVYDLRKYVNKFLALRSVYSMREEMGIISKKEKTT